jgi:hypothetical protein
MDVKFRYTKFLTALLLVATACIDPYTPQVVQQDIRALVVDGFVNTTASTVEVDLSRTLPLLAEQAYEPVTDALVTLEAEGGNYFSLPHTDQGKYRLEGLVLDESVKYRLLIKTTDNEYHSDFVTLKSSPVLDEVGWEISPDGAGVQIYVNAHDPSNQTRYYQWVFEETWEYTSELVSIYILDNDELRIRNDDEMVDRCWKTQNSNKILISQTTHLTNDVVHKFPVHFISKESQKISIHYSVLVQQRALDETTYNYLQQLQKTTEVMGGLFDPMPSQVTGNIYSVNSDSEPVIGYFRGGAVQEKRLFITRSELRPHFPPNLSFLCSTQSVFGVDNLKKALPHYQPVNTLGGAIFIAPISCMDCRASGGGVLTKPVFWP